MVLIWTHLLRMDLASLLRNPAIRVDEHLRPELSAHDDGVRSASVVMLSGRGTLALRAGSTLA